jgi:hypothetical protein
MNLAKGCSVGRKRNAKRPVADGILSQYSSNTTVSNETIHKSPQKKKTKIDSKVASKLVFLTDDAWVHTDHICSAFELISRDYDLQGLCTPAVFVKPASIHLHIKTISPFSAFIVHAKDHWVTVTNVNPNIDSEMSTKCDWVVYDSLNNETYLKYTRPLFVRVAELDKDFQGKYETVEVESQEGSKDCGLFALAYVLAIANKKDPAKLRFVQSSMRAHFNSCIQLGKFTEFESEEIDKDTTYIERRFNKLNNKK